MTDKNDVTEMTNIQGPSNKNKKKKKLTKKQRQKRKLILFAVEFVVLLLLLVALYVWSILSKVNFEDFSKEDAGINEDLDERLLKDYTNIAIFGLDSRPGTSYDSGLIDVVMIASIDNDTKEVRLVSVYRDTYLSVGKGNYNKINSAFAKGGAKNAVQALNTNLDLNITDYVCVDWNALIETIDALGGVEIEVQDNEVSYINSYVDDTADWVKGADRAHVSSAGLQTLNGTQATAYARIRYTAGDDFMRAARQRIVLQAMMDKVKSAKVGTLVDIVNEVVDDISTSFTVPELVSLASSVQKYSIAGTTGFPFQLTAGTFNGNDLVVPVELDKNVEQLHEYLFASEDSQEQYEVSDSVKKISDYIKESTGVTEENTQIYDLDKWLEMADPEWEKTHSTEDTEKE